MNTDDAAAYWTKAVTGNTETTKENLVGEFAKGFSVLAAMVALRVATKLAHPDDCDEQLVGLIESWYAGERSKIDVQVAAHRDACSAGVGRFLGGMMIAADDMERDLVEALGKTRDLIRDSLELPGSTTP